MASVFSKVELRGLKKEEQVLVDMIKQGNVMPFAERSAWVVLVDFWNRKRVLYLSRV